MRLNNHGRMVEQFIPGFLVQVLPLSTPAAAAYFIIFTLDLERKQILFFPAL
jgi:hypothetical protein